MTVINYGEYSALEFFHKLNDIYENNRVEFRVKVGDEIKRYSEIDISLDADDGIIISLNKELNNEQSELTIKEIIKKLESTIDILQSIYKDDTRYEIMHRTSLYTTPLIGRKSKKDNKIKYGYGFNYTKMNITLPETQTKDNVTQLTLINVRQHQ